MQMIRLTTDKKEFERTYALPRHFKLTDDFRYWPDEVTSFVNLSMSREVPLASMRRKGFKPVDAAELLSLLMYDVLVFQIALQGIGKPVNDVETADSNWLAFRGYFRCVYAAWLSAELKAVLNMKCTHFDEEGVGQSIKVMLDAVPDDFTNPGVFGAVGANARRVEFGGASRVFCQQCTPFEDHLRANGYADLPPAVGVATDLFNALSGFCTFVDMGLSVLTFAQNHPIPPKYQIDDFQKKDNAYWTALSCGSFFVAKTALSFLTKGVRGVKIASAPSALKMPSKKLLNKAALDELTEEIISSFVNISFVPKQTGFLNKATELYNTTNADISAFIGSRAYDDWGFRYAFGGQNDK